MIEPITLFIIYIVLLIISTVLTLVLNPKPKVPKLLPSEIDNVPIATAGKPIPVVFGRRFVRQPNVVWWGDVEAEPITMDTGGGSGS